MDIRDLMPWNWPTGAAFGRDSNDPLRSLQSDINRAFESFRQSLPAPTFRANWGVAFDKMEPRIDIAETEREIEITAELPGVEEADIEVGISDDTVTIKCEKRAERELAGKEYRLSERIFGAIQRSVNLPATVDQDDVKATIHNGVLTVTLQKIAGSSDLTKRIVVTKG